MKVLKSEPAAYVASQLEVQHHHHRVGLRVLMKYLPYDSADGKVLVLATEH